MNRHIIILEVIYGLNMRRYTFKEDLVSKKNYFVVTQKMFKDNSINSFM